MDRHGTVGCIPSCTRDWSLIPYLQMTNCQHQQKLPPSVPAPPPVVDLPCSLEKKESIHMYTARHITHAHKGPAYIPTVHASQKISPVHAQSSDITFLYPYHPPTITHQLHSLVLDPPHGQGTRNSPRFYKMRHEISFESLYACALSKGAERPTNQRSRLRNALAKHLGPRTFDLIWEAFQNDLSPRRCTTTHAQYQKWAGPAGNTNSYKSPERRIVPSIWAARYSGLNKRSIEPPYARI